MGSEAVRWVFGAISGCPEGFSESFKRVLRDSGGSQGHHRGFSQDLRGPTILENIFWITAFKTASEDIRGDSITFHIQTFQAVLEGIRSKQN